MKRIIPLFLAIITILLPFLGAFCVEAKENRVDNSPTRTINVVYDDSGSMINTAGSSGKGTPMDTWCQARYAMEVFAAMLGEKDKMNIYAMSDFDKSSNASAHLKLSGAGSASSNVESVHKMKTPAGNTPFEAVRKAYKDLKADSADEKWLVVLTDGRFQSDGKMMDESKIQDFFDKTSDDVKVMFLGMGPEASEIKADEARNIYFKKAKKNSDILDRVTELSSQVFNKSKLDSNLKFDIPMSELTVFAQGKNVKINGIKDSNGNLIQPTSASVPVSCPKSVTTDASLNKSTKQTYDSSLVGSVATFVGNFDPDKVSYDFDIQADTVEVYYKPDISIKAQLIDSKGEAFDNTNTDLKAGEYTIDFYLVKNGTDEKIGASKLLGNVEYSATGSDGKTYGAGDKITLDDGNFSIDAVATYLDYFSVSTPLDFTIFKNRGIEYKASKNPTYKIIKDSIENADEETIVSVTLDGKKPNKKQWKKFEAPKVKVKGGKIDFEVEKSNKNGELIIRPILKNGKTKAGEYTNSTITLSNKIVSDKEVWQGEGNIEIKFEDGRSWFEKNIDKIIRTLIFFGVLIIGLGYVPGIKKYLPRSLVDRPKINGVPNDDGQPRNSKGIYERDLLKTFIPYAAETGTIKYAPSSVAGCPIMEIKAVGKKRFKITNIKSFEKKQNILIDHQQIGKNITKSTKLGANIRIQVKTPRMDFTCTLVNR